MPNGDEILENKIRRMLYNQIISYPGVSFNTLKNIFELTDSRLRYHLHYLEKNNKISNGIESGIRCYYPHPESVSIPPKTQAILESNNLTPHQERILNLIMRHPGINQKELVRRTGINRFTLIRSINSLKNLNLIKNKRIKNTVCYEYIPDVEMKYKIMKGLMLRFLNDQIDEQTFLRLKRRLE
jgi:predicted transcriptional regulator